MWIMALVLLISLVLGTISAYSQYQSAMQNIDDTIQLSSSSYGLALENYLESLEQSIVTLAASGAITSTDLSQEQRQENLTAILRARPDISGLYTIGADGISINDSDFTFEDSSGEDYGEEEFFASAMSADGIWIDDPSYDEWTDNISLTITYRYRDGHGFDGVLAMDIHYNTLLGIIQQGSIGKTGYTVLVAEDGRIVTHPDASYVLNAVNYLEDTASEPAFTAALRTMVGPGDGILEDVSFGGETTLLSYRTISKTNWTLVTVAKPVEFMGEFYSALRWTLIAVALCVILSVLIAMAIGGIIAKPITAMTERMRLFSMGDLRSPMPDVTSQDELGVLRECLAESTATLSGYVSDISEKLEQIATGNVTGAVRLDYKGDFAPIKDSLVRILGSLNNVMSSVKGSSLTVSATSVQMASAAQNLSDNTIQQAATIETLSESFSDIKRGLEQTAGNTTTALDKTSQAKSALDTSRSSMDNMLHSMEEIEVAAASIEKIMKSIDDIAFQTNILALNAAVEAARAGQHGKGFAVVAEEVRNLATKCADAAGQTAGLIQNTLTAVKRGAGTAQDAWEEISRLEGIVNDVTGLVKDIEEGSNSQAKSAGMFYQGVEQLNAIVQTDSAMAEETAAASQEMNTQVAALEEALSFFTLSEAVEKARRSVPGKVGKTVTVEKYYPALNGPEATEQYG